MLLLKGYILWKAFWAESSDGILALWARLRVRDYSTLSVIVASTHGLSVSTRQGVKSHARHRINLSVLSQEIDISSKIR